jgi:hypothetical protein
LPANSPRRLPDIVLHIGMDKTGTTSIQSFLHQNRAELADLGLLYPRVSEPRRQFRLSFLLKSDEALESSPSWQHHRQRFASPRAFRRSFTRRLHREVDDSGLSRVLLSDEALFDGSNQMLSRLAELTGGLAASVRLVVYLRRQDEHLVSRYHQTVRFRNETRRLTERAAQVDLSRTYDYHARLRDWDRVMTPRSFVVRRFERGRFAGGSLAQDFLDAAGVDARADDLTGVPNRNETGLDAESVEFLRILNILRKQDPEKAAPALANRVHLRRLSEASVGPSLVLPPDVREEFMTRWQDSNRSVVGDFLHEDGGPLFEAPPRSDHTTSVQYLDPDRLDHFLTLLEIPETVHAPLRQVVAHEAARYATDRRMRAGLLASVSDRSEG